MSKITESKKKAFTAGLLGWFATNHRPMPWKGIRDPYLIWLSEIILQQTRVEQGWAYFEKFRDHYPSVLELAAAPEDEVMKLWEGLGYYSRARNLHVTAKRIANEMAGKFPDQYEDILSLRGVGPYTAAAIASFAFDLPYAVVDGNVYRVLARFFGIDTPFDSTAGKKEFAQLAQDLLATDRPADYNQAIMDFGAVQCKPQQPLCADCPLAADCVAVQTGRVNDLPVKSKKLSRRTRYFHYLELEFDGQVMIEKRTEKDIWQQLFQFPLLETNEAEIAEAVLSKHLQNTLGISAGQFAYEDVSRPFQQLLTHQKIIARFHRFRLFQPLSEAHRMVDRENLSKFAFPKIMDLYLRDNSLYLKLF